MDTGAQFPRCGLDTALAITSIPENTVVILHTASREIPADQARARCAQAAEQMQSRRIFKKIDSTLRGPIAEELEGLLRAAAGTKILVCPAAPQQGRVVKDGILYVNGLPLHESAFRHDPLFPARTASVAGRLGIPTMHLPLQAVRQPAADLAQQIASAQAPVITADAVNDGDLQRISEAVLLAGCIPCGSLGLASAWARALTGKAPADPSFALPQVGGPVLIVAGSANPTTRAQVETFSRRPNSQVHRLMVPLGPGEEAVLIETIQTAWESLSAIVLSPGMAETVREPEWLSFARSVSHLAAEIIRWQRPACLVITGGETANQLCHLLAVQSVHIEGEAAPGIPFGRISGGLADGLTLVTKAGGFGPADCLEKIVYGYRH